MNCVNKSQPEWIQRCIETHNYNAKKLRENERWTLRDTAKSLKRSIGSICEDILLDTWVKTNRVQMEKFEHIKDALIYVRQRQRKIDEAEIDA